MEKKKQKDPEKEKHLHIEIVRQMLTLATSGFGFVAALAWNNLIQDFVNNYIKKMVFSRKQYFISFYLCCDRHCFSGFYYFAAFKNTPTPRIRQLALSFPAEFRRRDSRC